MTQNDSEIPLGTVCADLLSAAASFDGPPLQRLPAFMRNDFRLGATLKLLDQNSADISLQIELFEYYSNDLKLAKLEVTYSSSLQDSKTEKSHETVNYFYNANLQQLVRQQQSQRNLELQDCQLVDGRRFVEDLFGKLKAEKVPELGAENWFNNKLNGRELPEQVIGLARLLFIIENNQNQLNQVDEGASPVVFFFRNRQVSEYVVNVPLSQVETEKTKMQILVERSTDRFELNNLGGGALTVYLKFPKSGEELFVDFHLIEPLKSDQVQFEQSFEQVSLFTLPLG